MLKISIKIFHLFQLLLIEDTAVVRGLLYKADVHVAGDKGKYKIDSERRKWAKSLAVAGFTPLMTAAKVGNLESTIDLFDSYDNRVEFASINATNDNGDSALHLAAQNGENELWDMQVVQMFWVETKWRKLRLTW